MCLHKGCEAHTLEVPAIPMSPGFKDLGILAVPPFPPCIKVLEQLFS